MKKYIFCLVLLSLFACHYNSNNTIKENEKAKNSVKKSDSSNSKKGGSDAIPREQLLSLLDTSSNIIGIWVVSTSQTGNASFIVETDTIYYPETYERYKYRVAGDSIKIDYEDYIQSLFFKLKGKDTLILKGDHENHIYYRVKK